MCSAIRTDKFVKIWQILDANDFVNCFTSNGYRATLSDPFVVQEVYKFYGTYIIDINVLKTPGTTVSHCVSCSHDVLRQHGTAVVHRLRRRKIFTGSGYGVCCCYDAGARADDDAGAHQTRLLPG
jgi:hypothetical protein